MQRSIKVEEKRGARASLPHQWPTICRRSGSRIPKVDVEGKKKRSSLIRSFSF
jgi:hypothetical protein